MKNTLVILVALTLLFNNNPAYAKSKKQAADPISTDRNEASILSKFKSCKEANANGVSNVPVAPGYTPPGWRHSADRDKDGIACEKRRKS